MGELDRGAYVWVTENRLGWLDPVFVALTIAGYAGLLWVALAIALAIRTRRRLATVVATTAATVWSVDLFVPVVKEAFDRPRPFETVPEADPLVGYTLGDSFPSGHAATSFAGAVVLALLVRRALPLLFALAAAVAFSRAYVGVHYPGDVLAGALLGTAWALAGWALLALLRRTRAARGSPSVAPAKADEPPAYSRGAP